MWKSETIGVLGVWLLAAPFVLASSTAHVYNSWVVGLIVTDVALAMSSWRSWERPIATAAGIWLFICGFIPSMLQGRAVVQNDLVVGVVLIVCAIFSAVHWRQEVAELDRLGVPAIDRF
jgi:hypothetical protein